MTPARRAVCLCWLLSMLCGGIATATVEPARAYRCTAAGASDAAPSTYSQMPCADNPAAVLLRKDSRTAAQHKQAQEVAYRDGVLSRRLVRERHHAETASASLPARPLTRPAVAKKASAANKAASSAEAEHRRYRRKNLFNARVPKQPDGAASSP